MHFENIEAMRIFRSERIMVWWVKPNNEKATICTYHQRVLPSMKMVEKDLKAGCVYACAIRDLRTKLYS
jgi:hypothetical protein